MQDLKRETNQKLKEEIIGNDHLTVANLNRIKFLEHENDKVKQHMEALDTVSPRLGGRSRAERLPSLG